MPFNEMKPQEWEQPNYGKDGPVLCLPITQKFIAPTGIVIDQSGYRNHGTNAGATPVAGPNGPALSFDGLTESNYVNIPNIGSVLDGGGLTVIARINWTQDNDDYPRIVDRIYNEQFAFYCIDGSNKLSWALATASGNIDYVDASSVVLPQGQWVTVALTYDMVSASMYVNGILEDTYSSTIGGGLNASTDAIRVGERVDGSGRLFDGLISNVQIYNRGLTAAEVFKATFFPRKAWEKDNIAMYAAAQGGGVTPTGQMVSIICT